MNTNKDTYRFWYVSYKLYSQKNYIHMVGSQLTNLLYSMFSANALFLQYPFKIMQNKCFYNNSILPFRKFSYV